MQLRVATAATDPKKVAAPKEDIGYIQPTSGQARARWI